MYDNTSLVSGMTQVIHNFQDVARAISRVSLHSVIIMYHLHPHNSHSSHTHPPTHTITPHILSTCTRTPIHTPSHLTHPSQLYETVQLVSNGQLSSEPGSMGHIATQRFKLLQSQALAIKVIQSINL